MTNVDYVNNASAFTNGVNAQSDASLQATFAQYVQTRSKGTSPAIGFAISQVQQGLNYTIAENVNTSGTFTPGTDVITVDDGSGNCIVLSDQRYMCKARPSLRQPLS